jgi:hypothetical protein
VHEYYLLGALCYIALGKWEEAMLFLELVLMSPNASQANGFMLEAYRKWVLVGCIINGRVSQVENLLKLLLITYNSHRRFPNHSIKQPFERFGRHRRRTMPLAKSSSQAIEAACKLRSMQV